MKHFMEILEAELTSVIADHREIAGLEKECAKLIQRRRGTRESTDEDEADDDH